MFIVNASPMIFLGKTGALDVLPRLTDSVQTTQCVLDEVLAKDNDLRVRRAIEQVRWLTIIDAGTDAPLDPRGAGLRLGGGEASVLSAALRTMPLAEYVLDDLAARKAARLLKLPVIGTIGILIRAEEMRVIPSAMDAINQVVAAGLYVAPSLFIELRKKLGR